MRDPAGNGGHSRTSMTPCQAESPALVVVGASVRAVAVSARRAGFMVHAADLFADADLHAVAAAVIRVPTSPQLPWPAALPEAIRPLPRAPWLYTGALENHPELVDRLARDRPLAGNPGARVRAVRDPEVLGRAVRAAGLSFPETVSAGAGLPVDGTFLVKPRHGAGGRGIARWRGGRASDGHVWQRFVPGRSWSAAFAIGATGARLFGAARQLLGRRWCGVSGFAWCGAVDVPAGALPAPLRQACDRLGGLLADGFGLVGLVGVDLVVDRRGGVHVIEVNPRPTASMELVERATGTSAAAMHVAACGLAVPSPCPASAPAGGSWAKAVVFAERTLVFDPEGCAALASLAAPWSDHDRGWPALADLPATGTTIEAGRPVLTVFAAAHDTSGALGSLGGRVAAVRATLRDPRFTPPGVAGARPRPPAPGRTA